MPWDTFNKKESCKSKYLVCQIIKLLADNWYYLYANSNLKSTTDTLFFQYEKDLQGTFCVWYIKFTSYVLWEAFRRIISECLKNIFLAVTVLFSELIKVKFLLNRFQPTVAFHIKASYLFYRVKKMTVSIWNVTLCWNWLTWCWKSLLYCTHL